MVQNWSEGKSADISHFVLKHAAGRCGDTSPHPHVLNIPLGQRVTSHAVGSALIGQITGAVEAFNPQLIILSMGFDAHKNDPMGLGSLTARDFGHITDVAAQLASKCCSGRLVSVLEGGYGIPCCRIQKNSVNMMPKPESGTETKGGDNSTGTSEGASEGEALCQPVSVENQQQVSKLLDLGDDMPEDMDDQIPPGMPRRLDRCHLEGFIQCVQAHVSALANCKIRK